MMMEGHLDELLVVRMLPTLNSAAPDAQAAYPVLPTRYVRLGIGRSTAVDGGYFQVSGPESLPLPVWPSTRQHGHTRADGVGAMIHFHFTHINQSSFRINLFLKCQVI